jgi:tRNA A37 threonylcarbamoyladenosine dehydratase
MFERVIKLIGNDNLEKIKNKTVCVIGLGGVGGYATESLVRSGIENIIIVDYDTIDISNLNRQIITNQKNIGMKKTNEAELRVKSINPKCKVTKIDTFINEDNIDIIFKNNIDYLIDACDSVYTKQMLIKECLDRNIKIISSMGTGNKLDPTKLEITDIRKTSYDPLAKKIRKYVINQKLKGHIPVVYSKEQNAKFKGSIPSMVFVPATAGLILANYVIRDIIND